MPSRQPPHESCSFIGRGGRNALGRAVLLAALGAGLTATADARQRCAIPTASASTAGQQGEPYQLARDRLAEDSQYRLKDEGQYRLNGAPACAPSTARPVSAHSSAPHGTLTPAYRPAAGRGVHHALINAAAKAANIQADLLHAVVAVESAYNSTAVSPKGAQGLMQLMPATAAIYTVRNPYDPAQNLKAGARHLRYLLVQFDYDLGLALAAYNAGAEAVRRYRNTIPPFPETRDYVRRVIQLYHRRLDSHPTTGH
jgi:soluble lytic murein transglycosylase-like protein